MQRKTIHHSPACLALLSGLSHTCGIEVCGCSQYHLLAAKTPEDFFHVWLVSCPGYIFANEYGYKKSSNGQMPSDAALGRILTPGKTKTFTLSFSLEKGRLKVPAPCLTVNRHWQPSLWNFFGWLGKVFSRMHKWDNKQGLREASWKYLETKSLTNWLCPPPPSWYLGKILAVFCLALESPLKNTEPEVWRWWTRRRYLAFINQPDIRKVADCVVFTMHRYNAFSGNPPLSSRLKWY